MDRTKTRPAGSVRFGELPDDIQDDVVFSLADLLREDADEVRIGLENGPSILPLVWVSAEEIHDPNQRLSEMAIERYAEDLRAGDQFPPVVIDSSKGAMVALQEGRHRTAAAVEAGIDEILAVDLAHRRIVRREGVETYVFGKPQKEPARR